MSIPHPDSLDWNPETMTPMPSFFGSIDLSPERLTHCVLLKENWLKTDLSCPKMMSGHEFVGQRMLRYQILANAQLHTLEGNHGHQRGI
jgi:hypothetical protein